MLNHLLETTMFGSDKPNILVLDIDLTLGCFDILYSIFTFLPFQPFVTPSICKEFLPSLVPILEKSGVFRPGLRKFLRYVKRLKQMGSIHAVILYTNQAQPSPMDEWWPITPFVTACFQTLSESEEPLFDRIYRRPYNVQRTDPPNPKDIRRILDDIGLGIDHVNMLFVDDYPEGVTLSGELLPTDIVYKIEPYYKRFETQAEVMPILEEVLEVLPVGSTEFIESVWRVYTTRRTAKSTSFDNSLEYLSYKLLDTASSRDDEVKALTWKPSTETSSSYELFWDKWCETDGRAREGSRVATEATGGDGDRTPRSWLSDFEEGDRLVDS